MKNTMVIYFKNGLSLAVSDEVIENIKKEALLKQADLLFFEFKNKVSVTIRLSDISFICKRQAIRKEIKK